MIYLFGYNIAVPFELNILTSALVYNDNLFHFVTKFFDIYSQIKNER